MQSLKWLGSEARHWQARKKVHPAICCDGLDPSLRGKRFHALTVRYGPIVNEAKIILTRWRRLFRKAITDDVQCPFSNAVIDPALKTNLTSSRFGNI